MHEIIIFCLYILTFSRLGKNAADYILRYFFLIFLEILHKMSMRQCLFSNKKKIIIKMSSAEFAYKVVKVICCKYLDTVSMAINIDC